MPTERGRRLMSPAAQATCPISPATPLFVAADDFTRLRAAAAAAACRHVPARQPLMPAAYR